MWYKHWTKVHIQFTCVLALRKTLTGESVTQSTIPAKSFWTASEESPPPLPLFQCCSNDVDFSFDFFRTCKTTLGRGYGGKGSHCPMLLSEIVWTSYAKYVASFYVMWISTPLQSHVRAPPVQRWRCTILNKIITAATAVKLHGNRCSLNHFDLNL